MKNKKLYLSSDGELDTLWKPVKLSTMVLNGTEVDADVLMHLPLKKMKLTLCQEIIHAWKEYKLLRKFRQVGLIRK